MVHAWPRRRGGSIIPITPSIGERAADLIERLALSHGLRLADALIGATAIEHRLALVTANVRHFGAIDALAVDPFEP